MNTVAVVRFKDRFLNEGAIQMGYMDVWIGSPEDREDLRQRIAKCFAAQIWGVFMPTLACVEEIIEVKFGDEETFTEVKVPNPLYVTE